MIGCMTDDGMEYVTKLEHFRDLMDENTYQALEEFIHNNYEREMTEFKSEIADINENLILSKIGYDDIRDELLDANMKYEELEEIANKLQDFYNYMKELYGTGLEIANWHLNGDLEPFDNFFDAAEE